jgi:DNA-binding Lrp family transcriptional regulator
MRRIKLDKVDRRILKDLQEDGRMTNVELAHRAGISAPPCLRRVRALEEAGFIRGYHAEVNPEALGFGITVFAQVGLKSQAEADLKAFEALVSEWGEVWDAYQKFLTSRLTPAPNVAHVKSSLAIRTAKYQPGVPIALEAKD